MTFNALRSLAQMTRRAALILLISWPVVADTDPSAAIDALFAEYSQGGTPGAAVGVYRGGKVIFAKGYGLADIEAGTPITPRTQFHVASVSKQFTGFSIALLAREGRIDLDADVRQYLDFFPDLGHKVTTRHLLHHTSGVRDQWSLFEMAGRDMRDMLRQHQIVNMMSRQRGLNFEPGTNYMYSNMGYTLLAEIVHKVSGQSLREYSTQHIFAPLGMTRTFFFDDLREIVPGRANSYSKEADGRWMRSLLNYDTTGATSLFTTVEDLAHWAGNFSKPRVGDAALIEQVSRSGTLNDGTPVHYGFALKDQPIGGRKAISHNGVDADFNALFVYYPESDLAVAVLANTRLDIYEKVVAITDLYLPPVKAPRDTQPQSVGKPRPALLETLAGTFVHPTSTALTLKRDGAGMSFRRGSSEKWSRVQAIVFRKDGTFDLGSRASAYFKPVTGAGGIITALEEISPLGLPAKRYERVAPTPSNASTLAAVAGEYYSDELDITYSFAVENDQLVSRTLWQAGPVTFVQVTPNHFDAKSSGGGVSTLTFDRDAQNVVTGVRLHANRSHNVKLRKLGASQPR